MSKKVKFALYIRQASLRSVSTWPKTFFFFSFFFFLFISFFFFLSGISAFGQYLAEDYFMAKECLKSGQSMKISSYPALQNHGFYSVQLLIRRMVRWVNWISKFIEFFLTHSCPPFQHLGAPEVPPLCRETQSLGQQMLNAISIICN